MFPWSQGFGVGAGAVGAGAVVPVPVDVVVPVPVVGDELVVPVAPEGAGEEVGEASRRLSDADGVGLASGPDDVGEGVDVGLDPGVPPVGDGVTSLLPPRFVNVVPDSLALPRGWPSARRGCQRISASASASASTSAT